jgi:uncharacterized protein (TIGR02284 family)
MKMSAGPTEVVNDLIEICVDGQKGFEAAAKAVDDPTIKDELVGYSWQRQQFAQDLRSRMKSLGEEPGHHGSVSGAMHRGWMDVKSALGASSGHSILAECERGEDVAEKVYREAMSSGLPPEYSKVVETQYQTIQRTHDRIKALRDATGKSN